MTSNFAQAARQLLAEQGEATPRELAERATQLCERFSVHLARLLGDTGVQMMLDRSMQRATAQVPWLAARAAGAGPLPSLQRAMEQQDADQVTEAFVAVLSALVALLERLIGAGLVNRLLDEVWPAVFTDAAKDTL